MGQRGLGSRAQLTLPSAWGSPIFLSGKPRAAGRWGRGRPLLGIGWRCSLGTLTASLPTRLTGSPGATSFGSSRAASTWWLWTYGDMAPQTPLRM